MICKSLAKCASNYRIVHLTARTITLTMCPCFTDPPGEPNIQGYEKGSIIREGDLLKLKCASLGGYPLPSIKWIKQSRGLAAEEKEIAGLETKTGYSGVSSELFVKTAASDNGASYKCLVTNEAINQPLTASVLLNPVYFAADSVTIKPAEGTKVKAEPFESEAQLTCESGECFPYCNLTWYRDGFKVAAGVAGREFEEKISRSEGENGGQKSVSRLIVRQKWTAKEDGTGFSCFSSNNWLPNKRTSRNVTLHVLCEWCLSSVTLLFLLLLS